MDPLAESSRRWSHYHYASNNPIRFIDVDCLSAGDYYTASGNYLGNDGIDDKKVLDDFMRIINGEIKSKNRLIFPSGWLYKK